MGRFLDFEGVDAVLFDCDGVLVDSEPVSEWAWRTALAEFDIDLGDFADWVGTTDQALAVHFAAQARVSPTRLGDIAAGLLLEHLETEPLEAFPDAVQALERVAKRDMGRAVVSNSERWRLEALLSSAGLADRFAIRVCSDDVARPKPEPDMYLAAAELVGVEPPRALVVEDSPTGIAAARAAGMRVVAVNRGEFDSSALAAATRVVPNLKE